MSIELQSMILYTTKTNAEKLRLKWKKIFVQIYYNSQWFPDNGEILLLGAPYNSFWWYSGQRLMGSQIMGSIG